MSDEEKKTTVWLNQIENYQFEVTTDFPEDWSAMADEPPDLGEGNGASAARFLAAGIGHCLAASLIFCMQRSRAKLEGHISVEVKMDIQRNERGRWRIHHADVKINLPEMDETQQKAFQRCRNMFEDFCIVTASVRQGIDVNVELVKPE